MIKKINLAILFAFIMQTMHLAPLNASNIYWYPLKDKKSLESLKAPVKNNLTLNVFFDEESQQLTFSDLPGNVYTYYIYDDNKNIVSQGVLDFRIDDALYIDLSFAKPGTYTLNVVYNGQNYEGTFELQ